MNFEENIGTFVWHRITLLTHRFYAYVCVSLHIHKRKPTLTYVQGCTYVSVGLRIRQQNHYSNTSMKLTACPPPFAMPTDKVSAAVTSFSLI